MKFVFSIYDCVTSQNVKRCAAPAQCVCGWGRGGVARTSTAVEFRRRLSPFLLRSVRRAHRAVTEQRTCHRQTDRQTDRHISIATVNDCSPTSTVTPKTTV